MNRDVFHQLTHLAWMNSEIHGPKHWARVARFGQKLAELHGLEHRLRQCIELFAWTHDLARLGDSSDPEHSLRGADYFPRVLHEIDYQIEGEQLQLIARAIHYHNGGLDAETAFHQGWFDGLEWDKESLLLTIGACWDADRLDLLRLGIEPRPDKMSTPFWEDVLADAKKIHQTRSSPSIHI